MWLNKLFSVSRETIRRCLCDHCFIFDARLPSVRGSMIIRMICAFCDKPKRVGYLRN